MLENGGIKNLGGGLQNPPHPFVGEGQDPENL